MAKIVRVRRLEPDFINRMWPNSKKALREGMIENSEEVFARYNVSTVGLAKAFGQATVESGGGVTLVENLNYSEKNLNSVFGVGRHSAKITPAEAKRLAFKPELIAERVYGTGNPAKARELGNIGKGAAWRNRGSGIIQITGGAAQKAVGDLCGVDLASHPEYARDPQYALMVMFGFFEWKKVVNRLDTITVEALTRVVNGGKMHLAERISFTNRAQLIADAVYSRKTVVGFMSRPEENSQVIEDAEYTSLDSTVNQLETPLEERTEEIIVAPDDTVVDDGSKDIKFIDPVTRETVPDTILATFGDQDSPYVRLAQEMLEKNGYHCGAKDGDYESLFRDAMFSFQADNGFPLQVNLTKNMMEKMKTMEPRRLSLTRVEATEKSPALAESFTVRVGQWIKRGAVAVLSFCGVDVAADAGISDMFSAAFGERTKLGEFFSVLIGIVKYIINSPIFLGLIAVAVLYGAHMIIKTRVMEHKSGANLGR